MSFKSEFLERYLAFGIGSLSKRDIDVLVLHLLDEEGDSKDSEPLKGMTNQQVSLKLRTPVSKIKSLRYEAALKYGGNSDELAKYAKWEFLKVVANAKLEFEHDRVCFVIEDVLTKNWLQGVLKEDGLMFDSSFNSEIVKIDAGRFCEALKAVYGDIGIEGLIEKIKNAKTAREIESAKREFIKGLANSVGGTVPAFIKMILV